MAEFGFYHPDRGYWQTIDGLVEDLLPRYPEGTVNIPLKPDIDYEWINNEWVYVEPPTVYPDRITARQFGLQLIELELKSSVDAWVATQDEKTKWAYQSSSTFVRTDPMMQTGFTSLGFNEQQINEFFLAASLL